jgi:RNA polymerase sigma factor (sigma-70 family)
MPRLAPRAAAPAPAVRFRDPADRAEQETARLYAEFGTKIYRHCLGQLRSHEDAEDALQNTFLRVYMALRRGVVPEFEAPWLYKIAHNVCLSRRLGATRRARVEAPHDLTELEGRTPSLLRVHDELFGLDDALASMPPRLRRAILLREWQGLSYAEIAESLSVSQSAVETLIFRARRHLAQALERTVVKPVRKSARALNAGPLIGAAKALLGGAGAVKLAAGAAVVAVALIGGVEAERAIHREISGHPGPSSPAVADQAVTPASSASGIDSTGASLRTGARGRASGPSLLTGLGGASPLAPGSGASASGAPGPDGGSGATPTAPESPGGSGANTPQPSAPPAPTTNTPTVPGSTTTSPSLPPTVPLPTAPDPTLPTQPDPTLPEPTLPEPTLPNPTLPDPTTTPLPTDTTPPPLPTVPTLP